MAGLQNYIVPQVDVGDFYQAQAAGRQQRQQQDQQTALTNYLPKALAGGPEAQDAISNIASTGGTNLALMGPLLQHVQNMDDRQRKDAEADAVSLTTAFQGWDPNKSTPQDVEARKQAAISGMSAKAREVFLSLPPDQIQGALERAQHMPSVIAADREAQQFALEMDSKRHGMKVQDATITETHRHNVAGEKIDELKATGGGLGATPDALNFAVDSFLAGDPTAIKGFARNKAIQTQLLNLVPERARLLNMSPRDVLARRAELGGLMQGQRTLGSRQANIDTASAEAHNFAQQAIEASRRVPRGRYVPLNQITQGLQVMTSDPDLAYFATKAIGLAGAAATVAGRGTPNQFLQEEYFKRLSTAPSQEAFEKTAQAIMEEAEGVSQSTRGVREEMSREITGEQAPGQAKPSNGAAPPAASLKPGVVTHFANGQSWTLDASGQPVQVK